MGWNIRKCQDSGQERMLTRKSRNTIYLRKRELKDPNDSLRMGN